jgi:hypothetical protein
MRSISRQAQRVQAQRVRGPLSQSSGASASYGVA